MKKWFVSILLVLTSCLVCLGLVACGSSKKIEYIVDGVVYHTSEIKNAIVSNEPENPTNEDEMFRGWFLDNGIWQRPLTAEELRGLCDSSNDTLRVYAKFVDYSCELDNKNHVYVTIEEIEATCTEQGKKVESCSVCNHEKTTMYNSLSHEYDSGEVTTEATCEEDGIRTFTCSRENCEHFYTETIPAMSHDYGDGEVTTEATCREYGIRTFTCSRENCNHSYIQVLSKLSHEYGDGEVTTEATCEENGILTFTCSRENCEHFYTETIPAMSHDYGDGEVTTEATCEEDGILTFTCLRENCEHFYTETIPAMSHDYGDGEITTEATCEEDGILTFTCSRENCGKTYTESILAMGYHDCNINGNCNKCLAENVCSKYFVAEGDTLTGYNGTEVNVIVPAMFNGVVITRLDHTFANNDADIQSVYIPDSVVEIGTFAFGVCFYLREIRMSPNIKTIGQGAFSYTAIESIYIPKAVKEIPNYVFSGCDDLKTIFYEGTQEEWEDISVGTYNTAWFAAEVVFNYTPDE